MIESNIIKRFIVKSFMQNSECEIGKIAEITYAALSSRFMLNENVILPSADATGKVVKCSKENYVLLMNEGTKVDVPFREIKRKTTFDYSDVYRFLEVITTVTPFGRVVIENVFERITQPGFGSKAHSIQEYDKNSLKGLQRRPEKGSRSNVFQSVEMRNQPQKAVPKKVEEVIEAPIDTNNFKKLVVPDFEGKNLYILVKIYTFLTSFKIDLKTENLKLEQLGGLLLDPEYTSDAVMCIHKLFIEAIEKDIAHSGYRFVNELFLCIGRLPDTEGETIRDQKKKRTALDSDNWKQQVKNFIHNFSIEMSSDKPLRFLEFSKKDSIDLRLEFLDFLFTVFAYTETLKSMVYTAVNTTRMGRIPGEVAKRLADEQADDSTATNDLQPLILDNPLMANIGKFRNFVIFLLDRSIILSDKFQFYILEQKDANMVLKELNVLSKTEKCTTTNLRAIMGEVFSYSK